MRDYSDILKEFTILIFLAVIALVALNTCTNDGKFARRYEQICDDFRGDLELKPYCSKEGVQDEE